MKDCRVYLTNEEKELAILRDAVDLAQEKAGKKIVNSPEIKKMIEIVENFIRKKKLICYGGTAINNLLPLQEQFYNKDIEIPDYDFFSSTPVDDAKELADIYYQHGYEEVEAKAGQHYGTYKVFVDFIPVADITLLEKKLFNTVKRESVKVDGILYAPPNLLRMSMYLELSRPAGDTTRWEKVLKRLLLLNKHYPLKGDKCNQVDFQRSFENEKNEDEINNIVKSTLISQGVVFFGGYAVNLYSKYMPKKDYKKIEDYPDFDVLSEDAFKTATIVKERLNDEGYKNVKVVKMPQIGEIISTHYEIRVGTETVAFIYQPLGCHSFNIINLKGAKLKVATIDTMLSFYLAFLYASLPYYDTNRILCMTEYLFKVQEQNRLSQKGLLRRFSISCYGEQPTKETILSEKTDKFKELKNKRNTKEYEEWFLKYVPGDNQKDDKKDDKKEEQNSDHKKDDKKDTRTNKKDAKKNIKKNTRKTNKTIKKKNKKLFKFFG